jgi:integrase
MAIQDRRKVFHSFRHMVEDAFRDAEVAEGVVRAIMGHAGVGEADGYGQGYSLRKLDAGLQKLELPLLDVSHLHR